LFPGPFPVHDQQHAMLGLLASSMSAASWHGCQPAHAPAAEPALLRPAPAPRAAPRCGAAGEHGRDRVRGGRRAPAAQPPRGARPRHVPRAGAPAGRPGGHPRPAPARAPHPPPARPARGRPTRGRPPARLETSGGRFPCSPKLAVPTVECASAPHEPRAGLGTTARCVAVAPGLAVAELGSLGVRVRRRRRACLRRGGSAVLAPAALAGRRAARADPAARRAPAGSAWRGACRYCAVG